MKLPDHGIAAAGGFGQDAHMTDTSKLQALFEAALRDTSDHLGRMPRPAGPASNPALHRPASTVPVRSGFKPMTAMAGSSRAGARPG
jgi:hypothetical protein